MKAIKKERDTILDFFQLSQFLKLTNSYASQKTALRDYKVIMPKGISMNHQQRSPATGSYELRSPVRAIISMKSFLTLPGIQKEQLIASRSLGKDVIHRPIDQCITKMVNEANVLCGRAQE